MTCTPCYWGDHAECVGQLCNCLTCLERGDWQGVWRFWVEVSRWVAVAFPPSQADYRQDMEDLRAERLFRITWVDPDDDDDEDDVDY